MSKDSVVTAAQRSAGPHWSESRKDSSRLVVGAARELWGNPAAIASDAFPVRQPVLASAIWLVAIMAVVAPLAIRRYRTATVH
jgi:hypothetical protein